MQTYTVPDLTGYRPVKKAALLGVHSGEAAICCVSLAPSLANLSILGVLREKKRLNVNGFCSLHMSCSQESPQNYSISLSMPASHTPAEVSMVLHPTLQRGFQIMCIFYPEEDRNLPFQISTFLME